MKKNSMILVLFICITTSCNQNNSKNDEIKSTETPIDSAHNKPVNAELKDKALSDNLGDFSLLVPIKILDPKSQNVHEKFGIDFDGNCYTCDLGIMRINKKYFDIVNVCDTNDFYRIENWIYEVRPNELRIKTIKNEFMFSKIEAVPIYELKITGEKLSLKKKKISKFYIKQKDLNKFKQHDCGEFDG